MQFLSIVEMRPRISTWLSCCAIASLTACSTFSPDYGLAGVQATVAPHLQQQLAWPKDSQAEQAYAEQVALLLEKPLSADDAVQVALFNNRELQAAFYRLGISEAQLVQEGRLPNPRFSMLWARHGDDYKIEQSLTFNLFYLLVMPKMREIEQRNFAMTQRQVAADILSLAHETRLTYFSAVAANQAVAYQMQVKEAAEASAELGRRMAEAGNWSRLDATRQQAFYADAQLDYVRALDLQTQSREKLIRLLGLHGKQLNFQLADKLPELPATTQPAGEYEQAAMDQRLDLQAARLDSEVLAKQLGFTKASRFVNVLELGPARTLEGSRSAPYKNGAEITFELPVFDWGSARVASAEARYMQSVHHAAQLAVNAQSEVREAYRHYESSYGVARQYRDEIVPLRQRISQEYQLRYNGMLVSVFDLLADARSQVASVNAYIQALRDFWMADSTLQAALVGVPAERME